MAPPKMTRAEMEAKIKELEQKQSELERSQYKVAEMGLAGLGRTTTRQLDKLNETLRQMIFSGQQFARGGELELGLINTIQLMEKYTGSAELGAKAFQSLSLQHEQFARFSENLGMNTAKIAANAAALQQFGLGFGDYAKNMEVATNIMGLTADEVGRLNTGIVKFANEIKMMPGVVSKNFQLMTQTLMYDGAKVQAQFKNFQEMAQKTGVSVGTLAGTFGAPMDTIGGASAMAGKLNAVLGTRFSGNQLLMMDEDKRMAAIHAAIKGNAFISGEIEKGSKIGKFALNSVASILNMSPPDAKRFLITGKLKKDLADATGKDFDNVSGTTAPGGIGTLPGKVAFNFTNSVKDLDSSLGTLTTRIKDVYLNTLDRALVDEAARDKVDPFKNQVTDEAISRMRSQFRTEFDMSDPTGELKKILGNLSGIGGPGATDPVKMAGVARSAILVPRILELLRRLQTLPPDSNAAKRFRSKLLPIIQTASNKQSTGAQIKKAREDAAKLFIESDSIPFRLEAATIDEVTAFERDFVRGLEAAGSVGLARKMTRIARLKDAAGNNVDITDPEFMTDQVAKDLGLSKEQVEKARDLIEKVRKGIPIPGQKNFVPERKASGKPKPTKEEGKGKEEEKKQGKTGIEVIDTLLNWMGANTVQPGQTFDLIINDKAYADAARIQHKRALQSAKPGKTG